MTSQVWEVKRDTLRGTHKKKLVIIGNTDFNIVRNSKQVQDIVAIDWSICGFILKICFVNLDVYIGLTIKWMPAEWPSI